MNGISVFLANAAFFYPIYWLSMLVVKAGPALLHVAFLGHRLLVFELGPLWIEAAGCPPGAAAAHQTMRNSPILEAGIVLSGGIWAYEIWGPFATWDRLEYIDRYVGKKMAAIAEHQSQVATIPYGEGVLGLNRWRAVFADPKASAPAGVYAEVFRRVTISPLST